MNGTNVLTIPEMFRTGIQGERKCLNACRTVKNTATLRRKTEIEREKTVTGQRLARG
jgi:hypothetical protein